MVVRGVFLHSWKQNHKTKPTRYWGRASIPNFLPCPLPSTSGPRTAGLERSHSLPSRPSPPRLPRSPALIQVNVKAMWRTMSGDVLPPAVILYLRTTNKRLTKSLTVRRGREKAYYFLFSKRILFSMHSASSSSCLSLVSWPGKKQLAAWSIALSLYLKLSSAKHHRKSFLGSATLNHHSLALFPWCYGG